jgi:4-hydroxybenzoyl-CoA reductase subunit beta
VLCALGARVRIAAAGGEREIPLVDLYVDDGIAYLALRPGELLVALLLPPAARTRATYWKLRRRGSIDFPVLGVGAAIDWEGDTVGAARIYLGAVGSAPLPATEAARSIVGKPLDDAGAAGAGKLARSAATPLDNTDFAMQWRAKMVEVYVEGALRELALLPPKSKTPPHGRFALNGG